MVLRYYKVDKFFHLLALLVIPATVGAMDNQLGLLSARHSQQLTMMEQVTVMQRHLQEPQRHHDKRSSHQCGHERLESVLRSCESAASATLPVPTVSSTSGSVSTDTQGPLVFCGADCNHKVILYANECNNQEFLVQVGGACKLSGRNLTVECIYAVVLVKMGITSCIKMALDVDSTHEDLTLAPLEGSREYLDRQCCSLETSYESNVMHVVHADSMGRAVIDPPLEPPWLQTNSSDYQAVIDVVSSELCLVPTTMEAVTDTTVPLSTQHDSEASSVVVNGTSSLLSTHHRMLSLFQKFVLFLLLRLLYL